MLNEIEQDIDSQIHTLGIHQEHQRCEGAKEKMYGLGKFCVENNFKSNVFTSPPHTIKSPCSKAAPRKPAPLSVASGKEFLPGEYQHCTIRPVLKFSGCREV